MKYLLTLIMAFSFNLNGQELSDLSKFYRGYSPEGFKSTIMFHAAEEWGGDYSMIVNEINKQCRSYSATLRVFRKAKNYPILKKAIITWTYKGYENRFNKKTKALFMGHHCNWRMVLCEYKKQLKAKNILEEHLSPIIKEK